MSKPKLKLEIGKETDITNVFEDVIGVPSIPSYQKYVPSELDLEYIRSLRNNLYNREGITKDKSFAVIASFPEQVHIDMTKLHGPNWVDTPVLTDFLNKNPQYKVGKPQGGLRGIGAITVQSQQPEEPKNASSENTNV